MGVQGVFRRVWYSSIEGMGSDCVALVYRLPSDYLKRSHGSRMLSAGEEAIEDPSYFIFSAAGT